MAVQLFDLVIRADANSMAQLLGNLGRAKLVTVHPVRDAEQDETKDHMITRTHKGFVGGIRNKGITGEELVMRILQEAKGPVRRDQFINEFVANKFAGNSANACISKLVAKGKVRNIGEGKYVAVGQAIRMGATAGMTEPTY